MAKQCIVEREKRRQKLVAKYANKRKALKDIINSVSATPEEKWEAQLALQKMPRDASSVRLTSRCQVTGRAHGVYRKFGLGRNHLRRMAMQGNVPGLKKASW